MTNASQNGITNHAAIRIQLFGQKIIKRANDAKKEIKKMNALYIEEADLPSGCNMADMC